MLKNFLTDPNCSAFLQEFALQTINFLTQIMTNFEQEEEADLGLQRILAELQDKFEEFFNLDEN